MIAYLYALIGEVFIVYDNLCTNWCVVSDKLNNYCDMCMIKYLNKVIGEVLHILHNFITN